MAAGNLLRAVLQGPDGCRDLGWPEIAAWKPEQGFLYVALYADSRDRRLELLTRFDLDPSVRDSLVEQDPNPRAILHDHGWVVCPHLPLDAPEFSGGRMTGFNAWIEPQRALLLFDTRELAMLSLGEDPASLPGDAGDTLVLLLERLLHYWQPAVTLLVTEAEALAERSFEQADEALSLRLIRLRRAIQRLQHFLEPQVKPWRQIRGQAIIRMSPGQQRRLAEQSHRWEKLNRRLTDYFQQLRGVEDELNALLDHRMNRRIYLVTSITGVFFPLVFATGLLGVNLGGIPGAQNPLGFYFLCGLLVILGVLGFLVMRRLKWF
jgi:zinc transporter